MAAAAEPRLTAEMIETQKTPAMFLASMQHQGSQVSVIGYALNADDISEFMRRFYPLQVRPNLLEIRTIKACGRKLHRFEILLSGDKSAFSERSPKVQVRLLVDGTPFVCDISAP
jgi:hypothetical protein